MSVLNVLSCLGGYFKSNEFDVDIQKMADAAELSEDDFEKELKVLEADGSISIVDNKITLLTIEPTTDKNFNEMYEPVETFEWKKGMKLVLDK